MDEQRRHGETEGAERDPVGPGHLAVAQPQRRQRGDHGQIGQQQSGDRDGQHHPEDGRSATARPPASVASCIGRRLRTASSHRAPPTEMEIQGRTDLGY
ncbi:hypothetical protein DDE74_36935 [Streptomyces lydicus]|uniref:Uncharacterized protein n=1 Tax=Streptomyces lydicus TaxID=47763 RepID=A0A3Q9KEF5_9ACTN|nr:hypothetical protein [Streptomyces lydicus]AZS75737.1 hypothetical protein DDE74_36935 [Streptomyces lydicus]